MDGHDGGCLWSYCRLDFCGVEVAGGGINVYKYWSDAVPPQGVGSGNEAVGSSDYLAGYAESLKGRDEGESAVSEHADIFHAEVLAQGLFKLLMVVAVVGNPLAVPDVAQVGYELVERGKEGGGYGDLRIHINYSVVLVYRLTGS